ncbi:MAG TPA: ribonuclease [Syntrophus sp. (in: bacteria)]|nr:ribonuclease [Syntrophus sp. (in: bacteria)]
MKRPFILFSLLIIVFTLSCPAYGGSASRNVSGDFDYYVLALSWSPDFCAGQGGNDSEQCGPGRNPGFVLHGLWPQYQKGFPQNCTSIPFPSSLKREFPGLFPNDRLYAHEWRRHGTCSGLSPREYLAAAQKLKQAAPLPSRYRNLREPVRTTTAALKKEFKALDAGLPDNGVAVFCSGSGRFLKEIFLCYNRQGKPTACSPEIMNKSARSCRQSDFLIRPGR